MCGYGCYISKRAPLYLFLGFLFLTLFSPPTTLPLLTSAVGFGESSTLFFPHRVPPSLPESNREKPAPILLNIPPTAIRSTLSKQEQDSGQERDEHLWPYLEREKQDRD